MATMPLRWPQNLSQYWRERATGRVYAVRMVQYGPTAVPLVTGACGPLDQTLWRSVSPADLVDYDIEPDWLACFSPDTERFEMPVGSTA